MRLPETTRNVPKRLESKLNRDPYGYNKYDTRHGDRSDHNKSVLVKNLIGDLSKVNENDIRGFFSVFGEIDNIEIDMDRSTGNNRGQAIVHFNRSEDAMAAISKMNGFIISDTPIIVTKVPFHLSHGLNNEMNDDPRRSSNSSMTRAYLASKLAGTNPDHELTQKLERNEIESLEKKIKSDKYWSFDETRVLGLFNLVDREEMKTEGPGYVDDIVKDVKGNVNS